MMTHRPTTGSRLSSGGTSTPAKIHPGFKQADTGFHEEAPHSQLADLQSQLEPLRRTGTQCEPPGGQDRGALIHALEPVFGLRNRFDRRAPQIAGPVEPKR